MKSKGSASGGTPATSPGIPLLPPPVHHISLAPNPPSSYTAAASAPTQDFSSGGSGGGSGDSSLGGSSVAATAPAVDPNTAYTTDSTYLAQIAALNKALSDYQADQTNQTNQYDTDFNKSVKQLGWEGAPDVSGANAYDDTTGQWDQTDQNTSSGRAFSNQLNDYASRGLLQSSLFGTAQNDLQSSLADQLKSVVTGRQSFLDNLQSQLAAQQDQNTQSQASAKADAIARIAAGLTSS